MRKTSIILLLILLFPCTCRSVFFVRGLEPSSLRCEYRVDPLGIDETAPRLSWIVESVERDQRQTAYRILVASSRERLDGEVGDLWDSGKVIDDETVCIPYAGAPLTSGRACYWKVRVWDRDGAASPWSRPALFTMGLLDEADWEARWIGLDEGLFPEEKEPLERMLGSALWIWYPDGDPRESAPVEKVFLRRIFSLPRDRAVKDAVCLATADNAFILRVNGEKVGSGDDHGQTFVFNIKDRLCAEENTVTVTAGNVGDAPNPAGFICACAIRFEEGDPLVVTTDECWEASRGEDWTAAMVLGPSGSTPWRDVSQPVMYLPPVRCLRHDFTLDKAIRRAVVHATALGLYELRINGRRVGEDWFTPGWTDYDQRIYYNTYEVTELLERGENTVAALLGDGWYAGYVGYGRKRHHYGEQLRFRAQVMVEYMDGTARIIATGPKWKASTGPIRDSDFLMGETYDARLEMPGWDAPGFDDSPWKPVAVTPGVDARVEAYPGVPVRIFAELAPVSVTEPQKGTFLFDMGRNFAGVVRLEVEGEAGREIRLRFAERLDAEGMLYTRNLRSARATDTYFCKGGGKEVFQPRFTFHGFQYVEVTGLSQAPALTGLALSSDTPLAGEFTCSNAMVNQLFSNIYWTQRANFIDIPTDCPQRDERLGWTGDAQAFIGAACMIADSQAFFHKWLIDLMDAQREDGQFPMVAPLKVAGGDGGPGWADAGVICPWALYEIYGDRRLLEKCYPGMTRFIEFCSKRSPGYLPPEEFHCFGDWLHIDADTPKEVIYTAYFALSTRLVARAAEVLGKEAKPYWTLYDSIKQAFNETYVDDEGRVRGDTQCAYVLALAADLLHGERRARATTRLVEKIEARGGHLSTGFLGTKDLMLVLARMDRNDVAYRLLENDTFPSWGYSIRHGATSIWERWNGWTPEEGFADPGMNSFAHYAFGAVAQWIFETVGGIRALEPGFEKILIQPIPGGTITSARTRYRSIRGLIATEWKLDDGNLYLEVTIPANTRAIIQLPTKSEEVGSGRHTFKVPYHDEP